MSSNAIIFFTAIAIYIPMALVLLYVWYKFGKGDKGVIVARRIYIFGSILIIGSMLFL